MLPTHPNIRSEHYDADVELSDREDTEPPKRKKGRYHFRNRRLEELARTETKTGFKKLFGMFPDQFEILYNIIKGSLKIGELPNIFSLNWQVYFYAYFHACR